MLRVRDFIARSFVLAIFFIAAPGNSSWAFSPDEDLTARAAVLMDAATGKIIYQKEADLRLPPASTTKIMTAILTLESGHSLAEKLTVSKEATRVPASKLYLRPGQSLTIEELLYGIMLASANDAAVVLAEGVGGSVEQFGELMTKRAHDLGAINSHFTNPHGLTATDHYSTAKDLAILFRYAMKNQTFREIVQTKFSSVTSTALVRKKAVPRRISVRNHNRLLWNYDGALGGKTGYTHAALKCFVGAVQRNGTTLIVAILGARDQWGDTKRLLEYGFDNYDLLKGAPGAPGKAAAMEQQVGVRGDRMSSVIVPAQEKSQIKVSEGFILQVGAFRDRERAESLSHQINDQGIDAFVEKTATSPSETAYRVRVGPYFELITAQEAAQQILSKSGHRALILPFQIGQQEGDPS
ncbi:MAG TPA: SPOR domain-containing protein [Candidatus Eisenbacteria bacterium]|nr:SPOR domain-containing protein [Candidatus Eisenbacteria bacterium]